MRLILASIAGAAAILVFCWQQAEISHLRAEVARQGAGAVARNDRVHRQGAVLSKTNLDEGGTRQPSGNVPGLSAEERRFVLGQYQEAVAAMNLPATKASRLQNLLTERIAAALDAEEAAAREGFAQGSAETTSAASSAIAGVDREISALLGPEDDRRLLWLTSGASAQPAVAPAPPVVVNVITSAPAAPVYAEATNGPATWAPASAAGEYYPAAYPAPAYYPPAYYPSWYSTVIVGRPLNRRFVGRPSFAGEHFGGAKPSRPVPGGGGLHVTRRTR